jgi:adenylate cyclase class IV
MKENKNVGFHEDIDTDFLEYESKYAVDVDVMFRFKNLVESNEDVKSFLYAEGDDVYYSKGDEFLRHRLAAQDSSKSELTYKSKPEGASNNVARTEVDLRVDKCDVHTVRKFTEVLGFKYNFRITKYCHIYFAKDATLVFYSIKDHDSKKGTSDHYIEVEVDKELSSKLTKDECRAIMRKWENFLEPIGIKYQKRLHRQLFDIYRKF